MERLDVILVQRGIVESRQQARRLILAGAVKVNGNPLVKPGQRITIDSDIQVKHPPKYVSRGGLKLEKALHTFDISVEDRIAIDVGASTGGFTDCLLQHGAEFVYAIDVGYGQIAWKLRKNPRVQVLDKTNIRYIATDVFSHPLDIAVIDVSFISLRKVFPVIIEKLGVSDVIALVKPQFEAGRAYVKKGGIVDDPDVHIDTLSNLIVFTQSNFSIVPMGLTFSPVNRDISNIEYLLWFQNYSSSAQSDIGLEIPNISNTEFIMDVVITAQRAFYKTEIDNLE